MDTRKSKEELAAAINLKEDGGIYRYELDLPNLDAINKKNFIDVSEKQINTALAWVANQIKTRAQDGEYPLFIASQINLLQEILPQLVSSLRVLEHISSPIAVPGAKQRVAEMNAARFRYAKLVEGTQNKAYLLETPLDLTPEAIQGNKVKATFAMSGLEGKVFPRVTIVSTENPLYAGKNSDKNVAIVFYDKKAADNFIKFSLHMRKKLNMPKTNIREELYNKLKISPSNQEVFHVETWQRRADALSTLSMHLANNNSAEIIAIKDWADRMVKIIQDSLVEAKKNDNKIPNFMHSNLKQLNILESQMKEYIEKYSLINIYHRLENTAHLPYDFIHVARLNLELIAIRDAVQQVMEDQKLSSKDEIKENIKTLIAKIDVGLNAINNSFLTDEEEKRLLKSQEKIVLAEEEEAQEKLIPSKTEMTREEQEEMDKLLEEMEKLEKEKVALEQASHVLDMENEKLDSTLKEQEEQKNTLSESNAALKQEVMHGDEVLKQAEIVAKQLQTQTAFNLYKQKRIKKESIAESNNIQIPTKGN